MTDAAKKFLLDPYLAWASREGVPILDVIGLDLLSVETKPWPRMDALGAFIHLRGRGDFVSVFLIDIPSGGKTAPQRHLYEEVIYVLEGNGSTVVESRHGHRRMFEWGPKSLFAIPLNSRYQHFNTSGQQRVRLASTNDLCLVMNLFHDEDFVFGNDFEFPDRTGDEDYFQGEGKLITVRPGRDMWETNFVSDVSAFELRPWEARGPGSSNLKFVLADGTMHAHASEMPVGTYKKAHRHGPDFHVFGVHGEGYALLWDEGKGDFERVDLRHGTVMAPPDMMFHQLFNTSPYPARTLAVALGSIRYPFVAAKRKHFESAGDKDGAGRANQIEYEDQDPRIHAMWLEAIARNGVESRMPDVFG